jgi:hypothetical protein
MSLPFPLCPQRRAQGFSSCVCKYNTEKQNIQSFVLGAGGAVLFCRAPCHVENTEVKNTVLVHCDTVITSNPPVWREGGRPEVTMAHRACGTEVFCLACLCSWKPPWDFETSKSMSWFLKEGTEFT